MKTSLQIASEATVTPVSEIAAQLGIPAEYVELYGRNKAKINLNILDAFKDRPLGKYILVTAITPTPLGEGKTTTSIGLSMAR